MAAGSLREVDALLADQEGSAVDSRGERRCHQQHGARAEQLHQPAAKPGAADASHRLQDMGGNRSLLPNACHVFGGPVLSCAMCRLFPLQANVMQDERQG